MLCTVAYTVQASAAPLFPDVGESHSSKAEIEYLASQGIVTAMPDGTFGAGKLITRLEASEMIVKALQLPVEDLPDVTFADVSPGDEGYATVQAIVAAGIMGGNEQREFKPQDNLTRGQMASILVNAFDLKGTSDYLFRDVNPTYWAAPSIQTLFANGVTKGYEDNTYKPTGFLTKSHFAVFLARILNPDLKPKFEACYRPSNQKHYAIRVPVTNVWNKPNQARAMDRISIAPMPDMAKWSRSMNIVQKLWLVGRTDTQALYGDEVEVIKSEGDWLYIAVKSQAKTGHKNGYQGWVPKSHVKEYYSNYEDCPIAIVEAKIASLYKEPKLHNKYKFMDISYSTILTVLSEEGDWLKVNTNTDGIKYIRKADVKVYDAYATIPKPTQKDIVDSAKRYLGLPYVWAGASAYGYDCSGLMYAVYRNHGILIPRDSFVQATYGTPVKRSNLQPGDLMFFAYNGGTGKVYHVSMYVGDGKMIHAPNSSRKIEIISINAGIYKTNYAGARRYLK